MRTDIAGRVVENEDLVNLPNWLALQFRIADEDWFDARIVKILSYRQELDLRRDMLLRTIRFEDGQGRRTTIKERRLVSMSDMHLGALELALTAENWSAKVTVRSAIDGRIVNAGAKLYRKFKTACTCWCAPASRIFTSRKRRESERSSTDNFATARAGSSTNRDTSGRKW
jgi:trehalose/maltose hydrolase-like predicted phosphorylase